MVSVHNLTEVDYSKAIEERIKQILKEESDFDPHVLREWLHLEYANFQKLSGNLDPEEGFLKILRIINPPD